MSYQLVLREAGTNDTKAVGENIFLENLPAEFPVFAFYYPAETRSAAFEKALRSLGERTGNNLLLNMGRLDDPQFDKIARAFRIGALPALVVTAVADLAAHPEESVTTYVRLDNRLFTDPDRTIELLEEVYLRFLRGDVADAVKKVRRARKAELASAVMSAVGGVLGKIGTYLAERDLAVSVLEGRFELTKSG